MPAQVNLTCLRPEKPQDHVEHDGRHDPYRPDEAHPDILLLDAGHLLVIEPMVLPRQAHQHLGIAGRHRLHDGVGGTAAAAPGQLQAIDPAVIGHQLHHQGAEKQQLHLVAIDPQHVRQRQHQVHMTAIDKRRTHQRVGKGSVVRDSIIMQGVTIGENCVIDRAIIAEDTVIGDNVVIGIGSEVPNKEKPNIYSGGLATIGENSRIPSNVQIGKNTAISGYTVPEDYSDGVLAGGETLIKAGERS